LPGAGRHLSAPVGFGQLLPAARRRARLWPRTMAGVGSAAGKGAGNVAIREIRAVAPTGASGFAVIAGVRATRPERQRRCWPGTPARPGAKRRLRETVTHVHARALSGGAV